MKCLITGANGFIGRSLVQVMAQNRQYKLVAHTRTITEMLCEGVEYLPFGAIDGYTAWSDLLVNVDVVIHCAARVHVMKESSSDPLNEFRRVNLDATLNLARHAANMGVKRFIFLSSIGVNGSETGHGVRFTETDTPNPHNAYSFSKWEAEEGLKMIAFASKMEVVIIRPPLIYGPNAPGNFGDLLKILQTGIPLPLAGIQNKRSLIGLDNLIHFILECISHPKASNQTFLISDDSDMSTPQLIELITAAAHLPNRLFYVPPSVLHLVMNFLGLKEKARGLCGNLQVDSTKARKLMGWSPPLSTAELILKQFIH